MSEPKSLKTEGVGMRSGRSIPQRDQMLMHLQEQSEIKKKQLRDDYKELKKNVKENPYLQDAIDKYDEYFALEIKKLDALKNLLKTIVSPLDQREIKREIAALEKNLP